MKYLKIILITVIFTVNSFAQQNENIPDSNKTYFQLHSVHLDVTSLIFLNDFSLSADFEIYKNYLQSFGLQAGYSYFAFGGPGGKSDGSPFNDINLVGYTNIGYDKIITTQFILGYTFRKSINNSTYDYKNSNLKAGISFILNLSKPFKIYVRYSILTSGMSAAGLGISFGWER